MMRTDCGMLAWPAVVLVLCVTLRDGFAADRAGKRMVPFRGLRLGADDGLGRRSVVCSGVVSSLPSVCPFGTLRASSYGHTTNGFSPHVRLFVPGTFNSSDPVRHTTPQPRPRRARIPENVPCRDPVPPAQSDADTANALPAIRRYRSHAQCIAPTGDSPGRRRWGVATSRERRACATCDSQVPVVRGVHFSHGRFSRPP